MTSLPQLNLANTALIHEEVLLDVFGVLEDGWPVSPSFLQSMGTLAEAVVIHDQVFFDPMRWTLSQDTRGNTVHGFLRQSAFVQELLQQGALTVPPVQDEIDVWLTSKGTEYRFVNFMIGYRWGSAGAFVTGNVEGETIRYRNLLDLVKNAPAALAAQDLIGRPRLGGLEIPNLSAFLAMRLGFSPDDLLLIEGWNRRAAAYVELSGHLGIHLYPVYGALPHQLGAVGAHHFEVRNIYESVVERVEADDKLMPVAESTFSRIPIPPFARIAMARCKGDPAALGHELLTLRERHRKFRGYLTDLDRRWNEAKTYDDISKLRREVKGAWETLLDKEDQPQASKANRILGFVWDMVKNLTPSGAMMAGGDKVMATWHDRSIIRRVSGLHDFYQELKNSPLPKYDREIIASLFPVIAEDPLWDAATGLAKATDAGFIQRDPLQAVQQASPAE